MNLSIGLSPKHLSPEEWAFCAVVFFALCHRWRIPDRNLLAFKYKIKLNQCFGMPTESGNSQWMLRWYHGIGSAWLVSSPPPPNCPSCSDWSRWKSFWGFLSSLNLPSRRRHTQTPCVSARVLLLYLDIFSPKRQMDISYLLKAFQKPPFRENLEYCLVFFKLI